tara:strand:- start:172 stop:432 length:261 start_codon:yes stop_codon:yes gene_type:complete
MVIIPPFEIINIGQLRPIKTGKEMKEERMYNKDLKRYKKAIKIREDMMSDIFSNTTKAQERLLLVLLGFVLAIILAWFGLGIRGLI